MILLSTHDNTYEETAKEILQSRWSLHRKYRILDISHLSDEADREKFNYSIEILDVMNYYSKINDMFKKLGFKKEIDYSILLEAITYLLQDKPFSDEQLTRYFQLDLEVNHITGSMDMIVEYEDYMISYEAEFILLGLTCEKYLKAKEDLQNDVFDKYARNLFKMEKKIWSIDKFITEARKLLKTIKDNELKETDI